MQPITRMQREWARGLKYVLHDIDDTITTEGKLPAASYQALWALHEAGIRVVPVTGRPAGWCDLILRQGPVDAVIGENGALVYYWEGKHQRVFTHPAVAGGEAKAKLDAIRAACLQGVPGCRVAKDQFARLYDLAIDFCEEPPVLPLSDAERIRDIAVGFGAQAKISSIHVNIWYGVYDKLSMAKLFFEQVWRETDLLERGVFFGDSPNDAPMFAAFPVSCAVANIAPFVPTIPHLPTFVTALSGGEGFAEAVAHILQLRA